MNSLLSRALQHGIVFYQRAISPRLGPSCRFEPSCSSYGLESIQKHGALRGMWLTILRVGRCGPWHPGGYDPVPARKRQSSCDHSHSA